MRSWINGYWILIAFQFLQSTPPLCWWGNVPPPGATFGWIPQETCCCLQEEWLNEWIKLVSSKKGCNFSRELRVRVIVAFKINEADGQWRGLFCTNVLHKKVVGHILVPNLFCQHLFLPEFYHCCVCNCSNLVWKWNHWGGNSGRPSNITFPPSLYGWNPS